MSEEECQKCHRAIMLNEGCEWPDDKRAILCGPCTVSELEKSLHELDALRAERESLLQRLKSNEGNSAAWFESLSAEAHKLQQERDSLIKELATERMLADAIKRLEQATLPCGHNEQYAFSPDGVGRVILCLRCKTDSLAAQLSEANRTISGHQEMETHLQCERQDAEQQLAEAKRQNAEQAEHLQMARALHQSSKLSRASFAKFEDEILELRQHNAEQAAAISAMVAALTKLKHRVAETYGIGSLTHSDSIIIDNALAIALKPADALSTVREAPEILRG